jgi:hypothetical protein
MEEFLTRFWTNLISRPSGALNLRFYLQPLVAIILATRSGIRDARSGRSAYLRSFIIDKGERKNLLAEGWKDISKLFCMACILDMVFQLIEFRWIYPGETIVIAIVLAVIPYTACRGIASRVAKLFLK